MLTHLLPICFVSTIHHSPFFKVLPICNVPPQAVQPPCGEFERGYLGDDGNAKTLHIGTLDLVDENGSVKPGPKIHSNCSVVYPPEV